jgi:aspartyl-tRNA(Asn)/glutamyl-tRNA(Gln) amidotransferase subunit A
MIEVAVAGAAVLFPIALRDGSLTRLSGSSPRPSVSVVGKMYYDSIGELGRRIHEQTISPVEVVEACLNRIETLNPTLNAFITVMADDARAQAKAAEAEINAGQWRGPLHGLPVAVKDFFDTAGVTTTAGFEQFKDRVPESDAEVVKRLRRAGAIVIGKTNMDALGMATTGLTGYFGPVRNPWNNDYVTGGSSAGSAAAVAAGLCFATVDTDAVGSVRLPAACCGVVGFKGSSDLISTKGILGDQPVDDFIRWMAHAAVTTRSVADVTLVLSVLTDRDDDFAAGIRKADTTVRIGVGNNFIADAEVKKAFDKAVTVLRDVGYDTRDAAVPFGDSSQASMTTIEADRAGIADAAFTDVDVILLPTLDSTVPTVAEAATNPEQGVSAKATAFANYYSLPVASVPCGFDSHNMPIGLQIVGRPGDERTVLNVAHQYELAAAVSSRQPIP